MIRIEETEIAVIKCPYCKVEIPLVPLDSPNEEYAENYLENGVPLLPEVQYCDVTEQWEVVCPICGETIVDDWFSAEERFRELYTEVARTPSSDNNYCSDEILRISWMKFLGFEDEEDENDEYE